MSDALSLQPDRPRVLLVDDDQAILLSHSMILEGAGYDVTKAETAAQACELLNEDRFDLLICDLSLEEGKNGLDVIDSAVEQHRKMPVLLLTGYSDTKLPPRLARYNIQVVAKPANIPELLAKIRLLLSARLGSQAAD